YPETAQPNSLADAAGNTVASSVGWNFFLLAGDANRDRKVDLTDFTILAANFNGSGRTFGQGNFDYDAAGNVDLTDFTVLAANFNKSLPAATMTGADAVDLTSVRASFTPPPAAPLSGALAKDVKNDKFVPSAAVDL